MRLCVLCVLCALTTPTGARCDDKKSLKMALVNIKCVYSDSADARANAANVQANLDRHLYFIDKAVGQGAEFVGFPELSINGYRFSKTMTWLKLDGPEVARLVKKAKEKGVYVSAGLAEEDGDGKKWNTQIVISPEGKVIGKHHKIWLTAEKGHTAKGTDHNVFEVKGAKMGICTCADGTDYKNLEALADKGAKIIYGPHANNTGGTTAGWYKFRAQWGGEWDGKYVPSARDPETKVPSGGWVNQLKVHAALHNHAGRYNADFDPPAKGTAERWASGAWFIGPDGKTLAQMKPSGDRADSKEHILLHEVPLAHRKK